MQPIDSFAPFQTGPCRRRSLLGYGTLLIPALFAPASLCRTASAADQSGFRAAIFGATGKGNFGHGLDRVFVDLPGVETVAVSDADAKGREAARKRLDIDPDHSYADYRELLEREKPDLVSIAPRWTDQHHAMAMAALESGAHLYMEKPFTETLDQADEILAKARAKKRKIAVAHQMRCDPHILRLEKEIRGGSLIGELLEIRLFGKMDARAGGEDLLVLGTHLFDVALLLAGDAIWCSAQVLEQGAPAHRETIKRSSKEGIGPLLGDDIHALFGTVSGIPITFRSRAEQREVTGGWGMELIGSKRLLRLYANHPPTLSLSVSRDAAQPTRVDQWERWPDSTPYHQPEDGLEGMAAANRRVVKDWLEAIREDREPLSSGQRAMKALEMIHAVFASGLRGERIEIPLVDRAHPLAEPA